MPTRDAKMAGHAANADEQWRSSVSRIKDWSELNEASITRHRVLVERLSNINPDVRDARRRVLPALETRRAEFRDDVRFRSELADERYGRIETSRGDAVSFRDLCTPVEADAESGGAVQDEDWQTQLRRKPPKQRNRDKARDEPDDVVRGDILASLRRESGSQAESTRAETKTARAKTAADWQKSAKTFHDGKAKAAMARAQTRRAASAAEFAARREAREDAEALWKEAEAVSIGGDVDGETQEKAVQRARLRATALSRFRKVGLVVKMGMRAANAMEDVSTEGRAARQAEREAVAVASNEAKAKHALDDACRRSELAQAALRESEDALGEVEARAAEAGGIAARAQNIVDELRADKQDDATAFAEKNVEAWRAKAATDDARALELREKRDELAVQFEANEVRRRVAEDAYAAEEAKGKVARKYAERLDARAVETRAARALVMQRVAREVITRVRRAGDVESDLSAEESDSEWDDGEGTDADQTNAATETEPKTSARASFRKIGLTVKAGTRVARAVDANTRSKDTQQKPGRSKIHSAETRRVAANEAAAAAAAAGVRSDITESLTELRLAARALANDTSAAALGARACADDAERGLEKRVAALTAARIAADDARAMFRDAMVAACEASALGDSRETTFTLFPDAFVGRRLVAVPGPVSASPAFVKGVTRTWRLKPGLNLVVGASERGAKEFGTKTHDGFGAAPTLAELVETAVPPAPRQGGEDDDIENRQANAWIANAEAAAAGDDFDDVDFYARGGRLVGVDDETRHRRGSLGAAMRATRAAGSVGKWKARAIEKGFFFVSETEDFELDSAAHAKPPAHPADVAEVEQFNSVFRPEAKTQTFTPLHQPAPPKQPFVETSEKDAMTPPVETSGKDLTQTQLLSRFVRAQRQCARAESVAARAFRERRDARIAAHRLRAVATAFALAVPAADVRRDVVEISCVSALATLAEGNARYREACLARGPRAARIAKLGMTDTAYAGAAACASVEVAKRIADVTAATKALGEACAVAATAERAVENAKHAEARATAVVKAHEARWHIVIPQLRASRRETRAVVDPRAASMFIDDIDHEFRNEHATLLGAIAAASVTTRAAQLERSAGFAPVFKARLRRETAARALVAASDARDDARRRHSAASAVTCLDLEGDRLAEAAVDAAALAAVEGHSESAMRRLALHAAAKVAATLAENAERRAFETRRLADGRELEKSVHNAVAARRALSAAHTDLAQTKHELVFARDAERDAAAFMETKRVGARSDRWRVDAPLVAASPRQTLAKTVLASEAAARAVQSARASLLACELAEFEAEEKALDTQREAEFNKDFLAVDAARTAETLRAKARATHRASISAQKTSDAVLALSEQKGSPGRTRGEVDETTVRTPTVKSPRPSKPNLSALDSALATAALAAANLASARETSECASRAVDVARVEAAEAADRALAEASRRQAVAEGIDETRIDETRIEFGAASPATETAVAFFRRATSNAAQAETTAVTLRASGPCLDAAIAAAEDAASCAFAVVEETRRVLDQGLSRARADAEETAKVLAAATAEKRKASEARRRASLALRDARAAVDAAREAEKEREARRMRRAEEKRRGGRDARSGTGRIV